MTTDAADIGALREAAADDLMRWRVDRDCRRNSNPCEHSEGDITRAAIRADAAASRLVAAILNLAADDSAAEAAS